jgi:hypothetical protein
MIAAGATLAIVGLVVGALRLGVTVDSSPEASMRKGSLVVEVDPPDAEVFLDGNKLAVTASGRIGSVKAETEPGVHKLRVARKDYVEQERSVTVEGGKAENVKIVLVKGDRWTLAFNRADGQDYANQLLQLGAILAVPDPGNPDKYLIIRNLKERPVRPTPGDLDQIRGERTAWKDDDPSSVRPLAGALGLDPVPEHVIAFFPAKLEEKLLKLELAYQNRKEEEIYETRFELRRSGGTYEPVVVKQKLRNEQP